MILTKWIFCTLISLCFSFITFQTYAQINDFIWAKSVVSNIFMLNVSDISTDENGNSYITGRFASPTITFGGFTLTSNGYDDIFITKYDVNGNVIWAKNAGGNGFEMGNGISIDKFGNVYVIGNFDSYIDFGTNQLTSNGQNDVFIAKYDTSGIIKWAKNIGGNVGDFGYGICNDFNGNIYITGDFSSPTISMDTTILTNNGYSKIFIAKLDSSGNFKWAKSADGSTSCVGTAISSNIYGEIYFTGSYRSPSITFESTTLTNYGNGDIYIAKYDSSGNFKWAKSAGGSGDDDSQDISTDNFGNSSITGGFNSPSLTFGTKTLLNKGGADSFIANYDSLGNINWVNSIGGLGNEGGYGICSDILGNSYVTGSFSSQTIVFGSDTISTNGQNDIYIASYDKLGNYKWVKNVGGSMGEYGIAINTDDLGNSYVTGEFISPNINFGATTLTGANRNNIFITKINNSLGIEEAINKKSDLVIYPNPATINLFIYTKSFIGSDLTLIDITGQVILKQKIINDRTQIKVNNFAHGIYLLKIQNKENISFERIVIE